MIPHIVTTLSYIIPRAEKKRRKRTTSFYFRMPGVEIVIWKKEYRPVAMPRVTDQQIESARARMLEFETVSI